MDAWGVVVAVLRRWYVFLAVLACGLAIVFAVDRSSYAEYTTEGGAVLVAPRGTIPGPDNPFTTASGGEALAILAQNAATHEKLAAAGHSTNYEVEATRSSPVVLFTMTAATPEKAVASGQALVAQMHSLLYNTQAESGIAKPQRVELHMLASPTVPQPTSGSTRFVIAVLGLFGMLATIAAVATDAIIRSRRARAPSGEQEQQPEPEMIDAPGART